MQYGRRIGKKVYRKRKQMRESLKLLSNRIYMFKN